MEGPAEYLSARCELLLFHFENPGTLTQKVNCTSESLLKLKGPSEPAWFRSSFYRWGPEALKGKDLFSVMVDRRGARTRISFLPGIVFAMKSQMPGSKTSL